MNKSRRITTVLLMVVMSISVFFTACVPPEIEGAKVNLQKGMFDEAYKTSQKAVELYPTNPDAWFYLGKACYKKNLLEEMVEAFDKSLELAPTHKAEITNIKKREFVSAYNYGIKLFNAANKEEDEAKQKKMREELATKLKIANVCDRDFAMAYILLGKTEVQLDRKNEGLKYIDEAAKRFSEKDTVLLNIGNFYLEQNDKEKALEYYEKAYEINKENSDAVLALSDIYMA
ncbi:MAG: tetratricopeptide repeat protein, partial [Calditrichia bacterium]|nr:tetratricopeptide repeat protein [Calditrichia bacterium]